MQCRSHYIFYGLVIGWDFASMQSASLGIHVLNTEQVSTSPRCDSDRCYTHPLSLQCQPELLWFLQSSLDLETHTEINKYIKLGKTHGGSESETTVCEQGVK